jgi:acetyl-CoA carboxylase biotin carboxyl carrier protein
MATGRKGSKQTPAVTGSALVGVIGNAGDELVAVARGLAAAVSDHGLTELIIETPDATFTVRRGGPAMVAMPSLPPMAMPMPMMSSHSVPSSMAGPSVMAAPPPVVDDKSHIVKSPFVGTFYRRPNPDAPEYIKINDRVGKGTVLCIIEAMKLMNEIEADIAGTLLAVLAEDGAPVEYDQPLFKIAPA